MQCSRYLIQLIVRDPDCVVTMFAGMRSSAKLPGEVTPVASEGAGTLTPSTSRRTLSGLLTAPRQRPGFVDLVRDVRRKSLRRRKLWMNNDTDIVSLDQNKNIGFLTPARRFSSALVTPHSTVRRNKCDAGLGLGSYKKIGSPVFPENQQLASPQTPDTSFMRSVSEKENIDPIRTDKKQRRSSLFTPTSIRLRYFQNKLTILNPKSKSNKVKLGEGRLG